MNVEYKIYQILLQEIIDNHKPDTKYFPDNSSYTEECIKTHLYALETGGYLILDRRHDVPYVKEVTWDGYELLRFLNLSVIQKILNQGGSYSDLTITELKAYILKRYRVI